MASSGTFDFNLEVDEIIEEAYERIGREVTSGYDARTARRSLNLLLTEWSNKRITLWTVERRVIPCVVGQADYDLQSKDVDLMEVAVRKGTTDYVISRVSRNEEIAVPDKTRSGRPSQFWFQRQITPKITVWPVPDSTSFSLVVNVFTFIEDVSTSAENPGLPRRFLPAMVAGLAYHLARKKARPLVGQLKAEYDQALMEAQAEDSETNRMVVRPSAGAWRRR